MAMQTTPPHARSLPKSPRKLKTAIKHNHALAAHFDKLGTEHGASWASHHRRRAIACQERLDQTKERDDA